MLGTVMTKPFKLSCFTRGAQRRIWCLLGVFWCSLASLDGALQSVRLSSGEQLIGEVLPQSDAQSLYLKSQVLGELKLPRTAVVAIEAHAAPVSTAPAAAPPVAKSPVTIAAANHAGEAALQQLKAIQTPDSWKGQLRLGLNVSTGDKKWTENFARGQLEIQAKGSPNYYRYSGSYSYRRNQRADGDTYVSTDRYDATMIYRRTFANDWFFQNAIGYRTDAIKGIDRELKESVGLGYQYRISPKMELVLGGGFGVEDFKTDGGDARDGQSGVFNLFQEFKWRPIARTTLSQKFNYYSNAEDPNHYNYVLTAALRVRLTDLFGLEFSYDQNYDSDVGNGAAKDDVRWRNALVLYF